MKNILRTAKFLTTWGLSQRYCPGLTPYCGLEVQKPTQALQSVKGLGYTFELNPKWERTMPSFDIFSWIIYRVPPIQISK
jgi:hypothetical protein